jgi:hypothetical protein
LIPARNNSSIRVPSGDTYPSNCRIEAISRSTIRSVTGNTSMPNRRMNGAHQSLKTASMRVPESSRNWVGLMESLSTRTFSGGRPACATRSSKRRLVAVREILVADGE